jgi:tripartite-type tricarboxylate transporter receptor subunit TctC
MKISSRYNLRTPAFSKAVIAFLGAVLLAASTQVFAQADAYPNKPITIVVGYPPGGSTDLTGRVVATELARVLGVSVVVENVGGAGGTIGAQKVISASPDGYTLLVGANNEVAISRFVNPAEK